MLNANIALPFQTPLFSQPLSLGPSPSFFPVQEGVPNPNHGLKRAVALVGRAGRQLLLITAEWKFIRQLTRPLVRELFLPGTGYAASLQ